MLYRGEDLANSSHSLVQLVGDLNRSSNRLDDKYGSTGDKYIKEQYTDHNKEAIKYP